MAPGPSLQDVFLKRAIAEKLSVTVFLVNGLKLKGRIRAADSFSIVISRQEDRRLLVYKHAMATIVPDAPFL